MGRKKVLPPNQATPAARKRRSRVTLNCKLTPAQVRKKTDSENARIRKYRAEMSTPDRRVMYLRWNEKKRNSPSITRQKKQAMKLKDRQRRRDQRHKDDEMEIEIPHRQPVTASTSEIYRRADDLQSQVADLTPNSKMAVLNFVSRNGSPDTRTAIGTHADAAIHPEDASTSMSTIRRRAVKVMGLLSRTTPQSKARLCQRAYSIPKQDREAAKVVRNLNVSFNALGTDNNSRALKTAVVYCAAGDDVSARGLCRVLGASRKLTNRVINEKKSMDPATVYRLSLLQAPRSSRLPDTTRTKILEYYYREDISRDLNDIKQTLLVTDPVTGIRTRVNKRILEGTLTDTHKNFIKENPGLKLCQRSFECLRPRDIGFAKPNHRAVCCCHKHTNMDFLLKSLNNLSLNAGEASLFTNVHNFVDSTLCGAGDKVECLTRSCDECGTDTPFVFIQNLKCRRDCPEQNCDNCSVKFKMYDYIVGSNGKKVLALADKTVTMSDFLELIREKLQSFALHRFMSSRMHEQYRRCVQGLEMGEIVVVHDFAENYSAILPYEVQSLHWVNIQVSMYVSVVTRHADDSTVESPKFVDEHHIFLSEDLTHDCHFAEHAKLLLLRNLPPVSRIFEFCDGAASQFKCAKAFAYLASSSVPTVRYFWETSHGKHKADGAGGVVKQAAKMSVIRRDNIIRSAAELHGFCSDSLTDVSINARGPRKTVRREIYLV